MRDVAVDGDGSLRERWRLKRWRLILAAAALLLAAQLVGATSAGAKRGLVTGLVDSSFRSSATQGASFDLATQANAELVRIGVNWGAIAPTRPAAPRDPADPAYRFGGLDATIRAAQLRGFEVLLTVTGAPDWAEGPNRPTLETAPPGTWDPDPVAFGELGQALARRYSGGFVDPASADPGPLPRVRYFEAWNEPNLGVFLGPQWAGGEPRSPSIYRQLLSSFYDGVKAANPDSIVMGPGLGPHGDPSGGQRMRPLLFLRELFCLQGRQKLKPTECPPVKMDVLSVHPISTFNRDLGDRPFESAIHPDDASTADVGRLRRVLRAAEKGGNVQPGGRRPLWATEFWIFRLDRRVPLVTEARWVEEALYLFWKQRLKTAIYFHLRDGGDVVPTGLFAVDGTPKPALQAFRFPFVTERQSRKRVRAWGKSPQQGELRIERKTGGRWRGVKKVNVQRGEVFATKLRLRKSARLRAAVAGEQSLTWRQRG
jgi:hypothetical protein